MIPIALKLKNFLSYGSETQTINFAPYQLICLSGKNGHGKSALLDALTWAIWGQARKITGVLKADDNLLRLGQSHMMISLDLESNGALYRIKREYIQRASKGTTSLEFGVLDRTSNTMRPLTDKTIKATQHKINTTLGIDYESFINSAFLRQGQSHEFSKKSPKERKEILGNILNLAHFDKVRKLVLDETKQAIMQKENSAQIQSRITVELNKEPEIINSLLALEHDLSQLNAHEARVIQHFKELDAHRTALATKKQEHSLKLFQQEQYLKELSQEKANFISLVKLWRLTNKKRRHTVIEQFETEKQKLTALLAQFQAIVQKKLSLKEEYLKQKEKGYIFMQSLQQQALHALQQNQQMIDKKKSDYQTTITQVAVLEKQFDTLKSSTEQYSRDLTQSKKKLTELLTQLPDSSKEPSIANITAILEQAQAHFSKIERQFEKRKNAYYTFGARKNWVLQEIKSLQQKMSLTNSALQASQCPVCEQQLSSSQQKLLHTRFTSKESLYTHQMNRLNNVLKALKLALETQHAYLELGKKRIEIIKIDAAQHQELHIMYEKNIAAFKELEQSLAHAKCCSLAAEQDLKYITEQFNSLKKAHETSIENNADYKKLQETLHSLERQQHELIYDETEHAKTLARLKEIESAISDYYLNLKEVANQTQRAQEIHTAGRRIKQLKKNLQALEGKLLHAAILTKQEQDLLAQELALDQQKKELLIKKEHLFHLKGGLEQQKNHCLQLKQEIQEHTSRIAGLESRIDHYQILSSALGKDGIQALIIEEAMPEIEREANALLAKLTDNQAHLTIESLRDLKNGTTKETLDIKISDSLGIRPYELFSGGEAFRIDFALRIAISKLLARRAGTTLQTLIIDEGFGSQDDEGIAHILDCLYKIQDDFAKVIIVSHLPSMKDHFPVHFLVHKGPQGSQVTVIEQG